MSDYSEHLISMAGGDGEADVMGEIEARVNAATPGPWAVDELGDVETVPEFDLHRFDIMPETIARTELRKEDGEFIAHVRTDIPALLAMVREQRAALELARAEGWDEAISATFNDPIGIAFGGVTNPYRATPTTPEQS